MTRLLGVIGHPLKHSVSPAFQQAALDHHHLDVRYEVWDTPPDLLEEVVAGLRNEPFLGANITVPYKEDVLALVDKIDPLAKSIGAVNTIVRRNEELAGYNTDAPGFLEALKRDGSFDPAGKPVVVLGAGGAARARWGALPCWCTRARHLLSCGRG